GAPPRGGNRVAPTPGQARPDLAHVLQTTLVRPTVRPAAPAAARTWAQSRWPGRSPGPPASARPTGAGASPDSTGAAALPLLPDQLARRPARCPTAAPHPGLRAAADCTDH